jgi:hypothetical protein
MDSPPAIGCKLSTKAQKKAGEYSITYLLTLSTP